MLEINSGSGSGTAGPASCVNVDDNVEGKTSGRAKVTGEREREGDVYLTLSRGQLHTDCVSKSEFEYAYAFTFACDFAFVFVHGAYA